MAFFIIFYTFLLLIPVFLIYIQFNKENHLKIYQRIKSFYGFKFLIFCLVLMFFAFCFHWFIFCVFSVNFHIILFMAFITPLIASPMFIFIYIIKYFFEKFKLPNKIFNILYLLFLLFTLYVALDFSNAYSFLLNGSCSSCSSCDIF